MNLTNIQFGHFPTKQGYYVAKYTGYGPIITIVKVVDESRGLCVQAFGYSFSEPLYRYRTADWTFSERLVLP